MLAALAGLTGLAELVGLAGLAKLTGLAELSWAGWELSKVHKAV